MIKSIAIIGAGPSGLIAAEILSKKGYNVTVYDRKASVGRKFLLAGRGGLNLTHSEPLEDFILKYGTARDFMEPLIKNFSPSDLRNWCESLGEKTFIGSSGRIFPEKFKASPLLRAWLKRLESQNVKFEMNKNWLGWDSSNALLFENQDGSNFAVHPDAILLALGGASWPNLGSDGSWVMPLQEKGSDLSPLRPSNCGFTVHWTPLFREKFSGYPIKNISLTFGGKTIHGEVMIDRDGIEGGAIYALSALIRENLGQLLYIDLRPSLTFDALIQKLSAPRKKQSLTSFLERTLGLNSISISLLREADLRIADYQIKDLARLIKAIPIKPLTAFPIEKAISTAGGIRLDMIDNNLMLKKTPNVFIAGEMLDWEAPTGGYLLQGCFATGVAAAKGIISYTTKS